MGNIIENIQNIMGLKGSETVVEIRMVDGSIYKGWIKEFDGVRVTVALGNDSEQIIVDEIDSINKVKEVTEKEETVSIHWDNFLRKIVELILIDGRHVEGVLMNVAEQEINVVTSKDSVICKIEEILSVSCEKEEILCNLNHVIKNQKLTINENNKNFIRKLGEMLRKTEAGVAVLKLLPQLPILWCDKELLEKYSSVKDGFNLEKDAKAKYLEAHMEIVNEYIEPNIFEQAIIEKDFEKVEIFRKNTALLEELGYSAEEITHIREVDLSKFMNSEMYTMRIILGIQGNKNHLAERYLFEAYYANSLDMSHRLFPILIDEERGHLVVSILEFNKKMRDTSEAVRRNYYRALCFAEANDNRFYQLIDKVWKKYPTDEILDRVLKIATQRKYAQVVNEATLLKGTMRANEFEKAIIDGDTNVIRNFVKEASRLVDLGYTPEEVERIAKVYSENISNTEKSEKQIADRVYLYQKDKNGLWSKLCKGIPVSEKKESGYKLPEKILEEEIDDVLSYTKKNRLQEEDLKKVAIYCNYYGREFERDILTFLTNNKNKEYAYVKFLLDLLKKENIENLVDQLKEWRRYFWISKEEVQDIYRLRETEELDGIAINKVSKAIFAAPEREINWRLLKTWIDGQDNMDMAIVTNVTYLEAMFNDKYQEEAMKYALQSEKKAIAIKMMIKLLELGRMRENIAAQKAMEIMIKKGWFTVEEEREVVEMVLSLIKENTNLDKNVDYVWNSTGIAMAYAKETDGLDYFIELFEEYLRTTCAKQCCAVIAECILREKYEHIPTLIGYIAEQESLPYKKLVLDMFEICKIRELTLVERTVLQCIQVDYGNQLSVKDIFALYANFYEEEKMNVGLAVVEHLYKYTNDAVLLEVATSFLKNSVNIEQQVEYYNFMFKYLEKAQRNNPVEYAIPQMVSGELFLQRKGYEVASFIQLVKEYYPEYIKECEKYRTYYKLIENDKKCQSLLEVLLESVFMGDWTKIFEFEIGEDAFVDCFSIDKRVHTSIPNEAGVNIVDKCHRAVIRSAALFALLHTPEEIDPLRANISILWNQMNQPGCKFNAFSYLIETAKEMYKEELIKIWNMDIENITIYKELWPKFILKQKNAKEIADIFVVFTNAESGDVFNRYDMEITSLLESMKIEDAIKLCKAYERIYIRPRVMEGRSLKKEAEYENSFFSNFWKRNDLEYGSIENRYQRYKDKYDLICRAYRIQSVEEANNLGAREHEKKRKFFSIRGLFYYYSVLAEKVDETIFGQQKQADFIHACTIALSNDMYAVDLNKFVNYFEEEAKKVFGVLLLIEKDDWGTAKDITMTWIRSDWRAYLCSRIAALYSRDRECCEYIECSAYASEQGIEKYFWLRNYYHCKGLREWKESNYLDTVFDDSADVMVRKEKRTENATLAPMVSESIRSAKKQDKEENYTIEIPEFLVSFLEMDSEESEILEYKKKWISINNALQHAETEEKVKIHRELTKLIVETGAYVIKMQGFDEDVMDAVFSSITPYSIRETMIVDKICDMFFAYIQTLNEMDYLVRSISIHVKALNHLKYEQFIMDATTLEKQKTVLDFLDVLIHVSNVASSNINEDVFINQLGECKKELNEIKNTHWLFINERTKFVRMIQKKINELSCVPKLVISYNGVLEAGETSITCRETWFAETKGSAIRGVVENIGGASAYDVELDIIINETEKTRFKIEKISPGEKIPFKSVYGRNQLIEGKVKWDAFISYHKEDFKEYHHNYEGLVKVVEKDEEWDALRNATTEFNYTTPSSREQFCGREKILRDISELYDANIERILQPSVLITGLRRAGKTSIIERVVESFEDRDELIFLKMDGQDLNNSPQTAFMSGVIDAVEETCEELLGDDWEEFAEKWKDVAESEQWINHVSIFYKSLSKILGNRKIICILDEMENIFFEGEFSNENEQRKLFDKLRYLIQKESQYISFIWCGSDKLLTVYIKNQESQLFQTLINVRIGRMSERETNKLFERYNERFPIKFGRAAIDRIFSYTNGLVLYSKMISSCIIERILKKEGVLRKEVHIYDVDQIMQELVNGGLGSQFVEFIDANLDARQKAILRAIAMKSRCLEDSVSIKEIEANLRELPYVDSKTAEVINTISAEDIRDELEFLKRLDYIENDEKREHAVLFTNEIYRMRMIKNSEIKKFVQLGEK